MPFLDAGAGSTIALGYCTNVHAAETLEQIIAMLRGPVAAVRAAVVPDRTMAVGLYVPAAALAELRAPGGEGFDDARLDGLKAALTDNGLAVYTLNGFPYGGFHADRVKEAVFRPTWLEPERLAYTVGLAELLAELLPDGIEGSISTMPCSFKGFEVTLSERRTMAERLVDAVKALHELRLRTGKTIALALEPEPLAMLETTAEVVAFFRDLIFPDARVRLAYELGLGGADADAICHDLLGVCFDTCHQAVEWEAPEEALGRLHRSGVRVVKAQLSNAVELRDPGGEGGAERRRALARFDEPRYFHQVGARTEDGRVLRRAELGSVLADAADEEGSGAGAGGEGWLATKAWRVHFHVPLHLDTLAGGLRTTRGWLDEAIRRMVAVPARKRPTAHLEVETYTFDVLPDRDRADGAVAADVADEMAAEMGFALKRLAEAGIADAVGPAAQAACGPAVPPPRRPERGVVFLCTGNSFRSQIAETLARAVAPDGIAVASAGTVPADAVNPIARRVLQEAGKPLPEAASPKMLADLDPDAYDLAVTLCSDADRTCPTLPGVARVRWPLPDPARVADEEAAHEVARAVLGEIERRVARLFE